jgi:UDPglucose 6-dehydrogenase
VSGACFAELGAEVTCVDVDERKIARLKESEIPIYEPSLKELVVLRTRAHARGFQYAGVGR